MLGHKIRIFWLIFCINFQPILAKSKLDIPFEKYSYKSNFTDKQLFQSTFTKKHLEILKNETKNLFDYSWDKYMEFGFPFDEVSPLTCKPNKRDLWDESNTVKNDALGNFSITFFDAIDTSIIMGDHKRFINSIYKIKELYNDFFIDSTIQIFETNIRLLGSLLTMHLYAIDPRRGFKVENYDGFLLKLAYDLGKRLILSFSHIDDNYKFEGDDLIKYFTFNYPRTNLMYGPKDISNNLKYEQCTAGITSLTLEFTLLSKLTNDSIFEDVSKRAVIDFWSKRTKFDLIPMAFDTFQREFTDSITGIGASIDSFYEYALKFSILFNDDYFYNIWKDSYKSLLTHSQNKVGIFTNINVNNGMGVSEWIDSLGAFFPGLQVLSGDIKNSILLHQTFFKLWNNYGAIPERWNLIPLRSEGYFQYLNRTYKDGDLIEGFDLELTNEILIKNSIGLEWYPLRPELIESTYHLYTATKDPFYLRLGEDFLERLRSHYIAPCGFSGSHNILNDRRQDRQESFVLSETLKYLYLLFDVNNKVQSGNMIFTTEGHPFWFDKKLLEYDPIDKNELIAMNNFNSSDNEENIGFFNRLLYTKKFELNKEVEKFRNEFYRDSVKVNPYVYRIRDLNSIITDSNGEMISGFGKYLRTDKDQYENLVIEENIKMSKFNQKLKERVNFEINDDYLNLDTCHIIKLKNDEMFPIVSRIMSEDNNLYRLDWEYAMTLRKPLYLLDRQPLEIDDDFYNIFVNEKDAICTAVQTTSEWEALMASDETFSVAPIFRINNTDPIIDDFNDCHSIKPRKDDIFMTELEGLRLRLEDISVGQIDSRGKIITQEYIETFLKSIMVTKEDDYSSIVRITKLNGLEIGSNMRLFTHSKCQLLSNSDSVRVLGGHVVIAGQVIENLYVLD